MKEITLEQLKRSTAKDLKRLPIVVTKRGKPLYVIIDYKKFSENTIETHGSGTENTEEMDKKTETHDSAMDANVFLEAHPIAYNLSKEAQAAGKMASSGR